MAEVLEAFGADTNSDGVWFCQWREFGTVDMDSEAMRQQGLTSTETLEMVRKVLVDEAVDLPADLLVLECYAEFGGALKIQDALDGEPLFLIFP